MSICDLDFRKGHIGDIFHRSGKAVPSSLVVVMFCEWPKVPQRHGPLSCILFAPPVLANTLLKVDDVSHVNQLKGYYASSQLAFCIE
jgi:hypothetical protein